MSEFPRNLKKSNTTNIFICSRFSSKNNKSQISNQLGFSFFSWEFISTFVNFSIFKEFIKRFVN